MPKQASSKAYFALFLTSIIWGTTWVISKIGFTTGIHPLYFAAIRQLIAGTVFLLFFILKGKAALPTLKEFGYLLMMAVLLFVISNAFTVWGIQYINSGLGAIIGALFPIFVTVINWVIGSKNNPNATSLIGLVLGFAGLVVIFYEHLHDFSKTGFGFGVFLSITACISWAAGTIITTRNFVKLDRYYALGWQMFIGGIILNITCYATGISIPISQVTSTAWLSILYMVLFASVVAFGAFLYTLHHLPTSLASVYAYVNPVVAVILGHFILKESWSVTLLLGAVVTLTGVYLVNSGFKKEYKNIDANEL
jgi:drug/metabolite transporter (DMT)-like permease